ncbi:MAG: hypothetical protein ACRDAM_01350 [Casimicrobium sp.]
MPQVIADRDEIGAAIERKRCVRVSVNTTSNYLHTEDKRRAAQLGRVFKKVAGR